ncbi:MAG: hypothetical protein GC204_02560 [Chloroflexi bacterium]|nr:hypothetical protein [Chloroflexota bacterium]
MRSEQEIRREVEGRLKRRGLLLLDGGLWLLTMIALFAYSRHNDLWEGYSPAIMLVWTIVLALHLFRVRYSEKRKWDDSASRLMHQSAPRIAEDGELITFPYHENEE